MDPNNLDLFESDSEKEARLERPARQQMRNARLRKRKAHQRRLTFIAIIVATTLLVVAGGFIAGPLLGLGGPPDYAGDGEGEKVNFTVQKGATSQQIADVLEQEGFVRSADAFLEAHKERPDYIIQPGDYQLRKKMSGESAFREFTDRTDRKVIYISFDKPMRLSEALEEISSKTDIPLKTLTDLADKPKEFGIKTNKAKNLEGYLFPKEGGYEFEVGTGAKDILQKMVDETQKVLKDTGVENPDEQYRVLTIGSILRAEALPQDYDMVSGIIENRLKPNNDETNGKLQIDATVHYGLGVRDTSQLSDAQKADKSNKYNTYANAGMIPGPINSPTKKAIDAAAHPKENPNYYWVAVNLDTGETKFARTNAEHERNRAEFDEWCARSENAGKCN